MKRLVFVMFLVMLSVLLLASCEKEVVNSDATITLTDLNGERINVHVNEETDVASYKLMRSDTASQAVKGIVSDIRMNILEKTGAELEMVNDWSAVSESAYQIVVGEIKDDYSKELAAGLGQYDYAIRKHGNKIYIAGGSEEALANAAEIFNECFVYAENKSILVPIGDGGYTFMKKYVFDMLSVDGVDISEFSIYVEDKVTVDHASIKTEKFAKELATLFNDVLLGKKLPIADEMGEGHYIVLGANGIDADQYDVKIEGGNIYVKGSFVSFDTAYSAFLSQMLGYTAENANMNRKLELSAKNNISGSLGFTVPYTKQDLLDLFAEASESKEMVISGTHTYKGQGEKSWVASTSDAVYDASGKRPAILELDVGRQSVYFDFYTKGITISDYDLSAFVSESAQHVSNGGIICVCIHMANPLNNAADKVWYRGHLESEDMAKDMLTDGTEMNAALRKTLESTFKLIKALDDNGIPFMFRPLHEMNGGWFWWCVKQKNMQLSQETMQDFWKFFYNVVTDEMGIEDVLWVYAPNYNNGGCADVLYAYPGDEYVDIVGCDWYTNGNYEINANESYTRVMSTGKPAALTEVGPASGGAFSATDENGKTYYTWTCEDLLGAIKDMIRDDFKISYFLTWTGNMSIAGLGNADVIMNDDIILTCEDLMDRWSN